MKHLLLKLLLILLLCFIIILFMDKTKCTYNIQNYEYYNNFMQNKPFLWIYWDNIENTPTPSYIKLCNETVIKHCSLSFNIKFLNKNNIYIFLPELVKYKKKIDNFIIAHKVDIYRIYLLYKYGGLYLDADIIILKDPIQIINKLKNSDFDFCGTGCTGIKCKSGYGKPSNWLLASKPNSLLMKTILQYILEKINNNDKIEYHDIGKKLIWKSLDKLIKNNNYKYYHYPSYISGSRDKHGIWVTTSKILSNKKIEFENEDKIIFIVFYNSSPIIKKIKNITRNKLLLSDMNISKFFRKSLIYN